MPNPRSNPAQAWPGLPLNGALFLLLSFTLLAPAWCADGNALTAWNGVSVSLGMVFGALALSLVICLAQCWVYRDAAYARYAGCALLAAFGLVAYSGLVELAWWPVSGTWRDASLAALLLLATAVACEAARQISDGLNLNALAPARASILPSLGSAQWRLISPKRLAWVLRLLAITGLLLVPVLGLVPGPVQRVLLCIYLPAAVLALLVAALLKLQSRHVAVLLCQDAGNLDPLTGLMAVNHFHYRVRQLVAHCKRSGAFNVAVVYFEISDHASIHKALGTEVAEQCLLRSAKLLRASTREYDSVSRIGPARFGVILEGELTRATLSTIAVRVIAAGQIPAPDAGRQPKLNFHVAAILLTEVLLEADQIDTALDKILSGMGRHNALPLRFVKPVGEPDSAMATLA